MNLASLALLLATTGTITAVWWSFPALARPTLPFGVRIPTARSGEAAIAQARRAYSRAVLALGAAGTAAAILLAFLTDPYVATTAAAIAIVTADTVSYVLTGRAVRTAKTDGDWYAGTKQAVTADFTFRTYPVRVPWLRLAPAVVILVATAVTGAIRAGSLPDTLPGMAGLDLDSGPRIPTAFWTAANPVLAQAAITLATVLVLAAILRARPEIDAARPVATARRYRVYLRSLADLLLLSTAFANLTMAGIALRLWEILPPSAAVTIAIFTPLLAAAVAAVAFELRVGAGGHRLPSQPEEVREDTGLIQRDDDRHWHLGGFVYINREDPAVLVHTRAGGSQWTINLGHRIGGATSAILAAISLAALIAVALGGLGIRDLI